MDCSITPTKVPGVSLVQTTDFFYPNVEDPYLQGKIACANVLSDLYAMGVVDCDNMLMTLAASRDMPEEFRYVVTREMIRGFNDLAREGGTSVQGGQTVLNPWPIIGGIATGVCSEDQFIRPENAVPGDVLVLTKPLGTQVAVNAYQWRNMADKWEAAKPFISLEEVKEAFDKACISMSRLNRTGARLMHKYKAHGATDITGFGLIKHALNLAKNQKANVDFVIHTMPVIANMHRLATTGPRDFGLVAGTSAETSGGLFIALPAEAAEAFVREIQEIDGQPAWIVGRVVEGTHQAVFAPDVRFIDV